MTLERPTIMRDMYGTRDRPRITTAAQQSISGRCHPRKSLLFSWVHSIPYPSNLLSQKTSPQIYPVRIDFDSVPVILFRSLRRAASTTILTQFLLVRDSLLFFLGWSVPGNSPRQSICRCNCRIVLDYRDDRRLLFLSLELLFLSFSLLELFLSLSLLLLFLSLSLLLLFLSLSLLEDFLSLSLDDSL